MNLPHDRDPVFTSDDWTGQLLLEDELRVSYALRGAKDNAGPSAFNSRFKTEARSLFLEAQTLDDLISVVHERMCYYNTERRHSSISYMPPLTYIDRMRSDVDS